MAAAVLGARDEERGKAAADTLGARFVQLDVRDDASVAHAAATVSSSEERHDVLINNAGIAPPPVRTRLRRSSRGGRPPAFDAAAYKQRNVVEPASSASTALLYQVRQRDFVWRGTVDAASIRTQDGNGQ